MDHSENIDLVCRDAIDDSVWLLDNLPDVGHLVLRHQAARFWEVADLLGSPCQAVNHPLSVESRIPSDVIVDANQLRDGIISPEDPHLGSPNLALTSSTLTTRPASLSRRPVSMD